MMSETRMRVDIKNMRSEIEALDLTIASMRKQAQELEEQNVDFEISHTLTLHAFLWEMVMLDKQDQLVELEQKYKEVAQQLSIAQQTI